MSEEKNTAAQDQLEAYLELQRPIWHFTVDLGINEFKRMIRSSFKGKSSYANRLIKAFKKRGWMEYKGIARHRGSYPVHPHYGNDVAVDDQTEETVIKVKNGTNKK